MACPTSGSSNACACAPAFPLSSLDTFNTQARLRRAHQQTAIALFALVPQRLQRGARTGSVAALPLQARQRNPRFGPHQRMKLAVSAQPLRISRDGLRGLLPLVYPLWPAQFQASRLPQRPVALFDFPVSPRRFLCGGFTRLNCRYFHFCRYVIGHHQRRPIIRLSACQRTTRT